MYFPCSASQYNGHSTTCPFSSQYEAYKSPTSLSRLTGRLGLPPSPSPWHCAECSDEWYLPLFSFAPQQISVGNFVPLISLLTLLKAQNLCTRCHKGANPVTRFVVPLVDFLGSPKCLIFGVSEESLVQLVLHLPESFLTLPKI